MPVKINSFGGPLVWLLRKYNSGFTSKIMLTVTEAVHRKQIQKYINWFYSQGGVPNFQFLMLETVNRCNGKCAFCPANIYDEKRTFKQMPDELIHKILNELSEVEWKGDIFLQVNNEPFVDKRILRIAKLCRDKVSGLGKIRLISNGTLLSVDKMEEMVGLVDEIVINDYSEHYHLTDNLKGIYRYIKKNTVHFSSINVIINRRYSKEILATRAGNAPNKKRKNNKVSGPCVYPFTDIIVFPNGKVGICCNDCCEITDMGDVNQTGLMEIWRGKKFAMVRDSVRKNRLFYPFCNECDVVDAGSREKMIREVGEIM